MKNLKKIRTDVIGSLQRPPALKEARAKFDEGKLSGAEFRALEDQAVNEAVQMQEAIGLDASEVIWDFFSTLPSRRR